MRLCVVVFLFIYVTATQLDLNVSFPASSTREKQELYRLKEKRSIDFMGMRVSYPQYLRLVAIQKEVIRMDRTIRAMLNNYEPMELYDSLKKMLPADYLESVGYVHPLTEQQ